MSSLNDLFVSYKAVSQPSVSVSKFNPFVPLEDLLTSLPILEKVDRIKTLQPELPRVHWTYSGEDLKEYTLKTPKKTPVSDTDKVINRIVKGGYATDPNYAQKLSGVVAISHKLQGDKKEFYDTAYSTYKNHGLDDATATVYAAKDCLESGYGKHVSGRNNYGGIKGRSGTVRTTTEYKDGVKTTEKATFRDFDSFEDYALANIDLLNQPRYLKALEGGTLRQISKNQLGGIAEAVDSSLNKLGTWGKLGVQVLDPTGITGWKDFGDALKVFQKEGGLKNAGMLSLSALGAVPVIGTFKGIGKAISKLGKGSRGAKGAKALLKRELSSVVKDCIDTKTISEANKVKILELSKEVDALENSTNSAESIFNFIAELIGPAMRLGGVIKSNYKYF